MDTRLKAILADTSKLDRIRARELEKERREKQFGMLKTSTMPHVEPALTIIMNFKCRNCNIASESFTKRHDWFMNFIDVAPKLNVKKEGWMDWIKEMFITEHVVVPSLDPIVVHPAHIKMITNIQQNTPEVPLVFVLKPVLPQSDLQLVENILKTHDINLELTMKLDGKKASEAQLSSILNSRGNILLILDEFNNQHLESVLKACDFGFSVKIYLLPIAINSECFLEGKRGITKINFLEPYTIEDLLKQEGPPPDPQFAINKIIDHLSYDIAMNCPAMSTGAVAFLMMTEFRFPPTEYPFTYNMFNDLRALLPMIDFGFEGHTEDIVDRGIEMLQDLLTVDDDDDPPKFIRFAEEPSLVENIHMLWRYAQVMMPHCIHESIVVRCARKLRKDEKSIDFRSLIDHGIELCDILKFAVPLTKPCQEPESKVQQAFDSLAGRDYLQKPMAPMLTESQQRAVRLARNFDMDENDSDDDDGYQSRNTDNEVKILLESSKKYELLIIPMLDAYLTMAYCCKNFLNVEDFATESFIRQSIRMMREEIEDGNCEFWESTSRFLMESCLKLFVSWKIVEIKGQKMNLHADHNNKRAIRNLINKIGKFLEAP